MSARFSWIDVRLGVRMMIKHPALTIVGGLGIAVGIAVSVGFFSFSQTYIYPDMPLDEGERIVALENRDITINNEDRQALHDFVTWREELASVEDLTAFRTVQRNLITGDAAPELVQVAEMTPAGFELARVAPLLGRYATEDDARADAPPVVVIGYHVWQNRFAGDPDIVGQQVRLGRVVHTIIGVMPEGFEFPENHRYWTVLRANPAEYARREGPSIFIAGRLAPGATLETAQAELAAVGDRTAAAFPDTHEFIRPMVMPYHHSLTDIQGISSWAVLQMNLMVALLLVVIALNVAVLVYARTSARHGEIAMRSALGASRGRIVAQLFVESLVLALVAAGLGVVLAYTALDLGNRIMLLEMDSGLPFWMDLGIKPMTILYAVALAVVTAILTGVLPGLQATGRSLQTDLRELGGTGMRLGKTWTALIVAQVGIAVAALPVALNLGWSEMRVSATRQAYPADEFLIASLVQEPAPEGAAEETPEGPTFGSQLTEVMRRLDAEPVVAGVTYRADLPGRSNYVRVEGVEPAIDQPNGFRVAPLGIAPGYTSLFNARVLSGRALDRGDAVEGASAVVVTESFVRQVLGGGDALGRRIQHASGEGADDEAPDGDETAAVRQWFEIVGVVEDLNRNTVAPELVTPVVYYAVGPEQAKGALVTVRLRGTTPAEFGPRLRTLTAEVDPALRLGTVRSLAASDEQRQLASRLIGLVVGLILVSVLLLSAAGIYAMMSFTVTQRRREIGIRAALGAQPRQVLGSVFARSALQITLGLAVGIAIAALLEWSTGGGLVGGRGLVLFPIIAVLMATVGMLAAFGPARRGLSIEPTEALRGDR